MERANLHIRIDAKLKKKFKEICQDKDFEMGMVVEVFIDRYIQQQGRFNKLIREYGNEKESTR